MEGGTTFRRYLAAGLVDDLHLAVVPVLVGSGERLLPESSAPPGDTCIERENGAGAVHLRCRRT